MHQAFAVLPKGFEPVSGVCKEHGQFRTIRVAGSDDVVCPLCVSAGAKRESIEAAHKARVEHLHSVSGVPARFHDAGLKNFSAETDEQRKAKAAVAGWLREFAPGWRTLLMSGSLGTGKTHLVCALANNLISAGRSVRYTTMAAMLGDIKRAYSTDGMTEAGQVGRYVTDWDLLILDEADVMRGTENDLGLIFAVINGRYNALKPVVLVSNQPVDRLGEFLGERTVSRLAENASVVVCNWQSYRRAA